MLPPRSKMVLKMPALVVGNLVLITDEVDLQVIKYTVLVYIRQFFFQAQDFLFAIDVVDDKPLRTVHII